MKKLLFALIVFLFSFDLMGQVYEFDLQERYDSIPTKEWNYKFITAINAKFDSLINEGVDSIMVYYYASRNSNFALLIYKRVKKNCSIAYYEHIPNHSSIGSEILSPSVLDSTNILAFYSMFKYNKTKSLPEIAASSHPYPTFGKFYMGKSIDVYGAYLVSPDSKFQKAYIKEEGRILYRELEIYKSKNK